MIQKEKGAMLMKKLVKKVNRKRRTAAKIGLEARKKAMVPRKWMTVFVRKKGTLWKLRAAVYGLDEAG